MHDVALDRVVGADSAGSCDGQDGQQDKAERATFSGTRCSQVERKSSTASAIVSDPSRLSLGTTVRTASVK